MPRYCDDLSKLGVRVHDVRSWSIDLDPSNEWFGYAHARARFHTTQDRVWLDGVDAKKMMIHRGQRPCVVVIAAPEFGPYDFWVSNGHHALAAYLDLGRKPYLRCFARGTGPTAVPVGAPWFDRHVRR